MAKLLKLENLVKSVELLKLLKLESQFKLVIALKPVILVKLMSLFLN